MKKLIIAIIALLHAPNALAAPVRMYCVTEFPTTSFVLEEHEERLNVRVIHHNGAKYAPFHNGLITPLDLETLKPRAEAAKKLPSDEVFTWPMKNCTFHENMRFECFGTDEVKTVGGVKLEPFAVHSSIIDHDNIAGKYREMEISFNLRVDGVDTTISMLYPAAGCTDKLFL